MSCPPTEAELSPEDQIPWSAAIADRIIFHAGRRARKAAISADLASTLAALRGHSTAPGCDTDALHDFLNACLDLLMQAATKDPDLAPINTDIAVLCDLARTALSSNLDDRPVLQRAANLAGLPGKRGFAARVPGRFVWLAAMSAKLPGEEAAAAAMLADDLAAVDAGLPLRALRAAAAGRERSRGSDDAVNR